MKSVRRQPVHAILASILVALLATSAALAGNGGITPRQRDDANPRRGKRTLPVPGLPVLLPPEAAPFEERIEMLDGDARVSKAVVDQVYDAEATNGGMVGLILAYDEALKTELWLLVETLGGEIEQVFEAARGCAVRLPADMVDRLLSDPTLRQIEWNAPMTFSMDVARTAAQAPVPSSGGNPGPGGGGPHEIVQQGAESSLGTALEDLTGDHVTIALIDSGVQTHPDLGNVVGCIDLVSNPRTDPSKPDYSTAYLAGYLEDCTKFSDPFGHGTHIAGILVGDGKTGNARYRGLAPGADLVSVRVLDGVGSADVADVITGIDWVIRNRDIYDIDIISLSLGGPFFGPASEDPLVQAVEAAWDAGIVVVASAGNLGTFGNFTITRPGNSPRIITVGSLTDWNSLGLGDDLKSSYSSMSPTLIDGYLKPDLVAPGNRIISTRAVGSTLDQLLEPVGAVFDDVYLEMSGTSMAAPVVAAAAALMLENEPQLSPDTVKARLMLTADPLPGNALEHGSGRVNVEAALRDTSETSNAVSPRVFPAPVCCDLIVENLRDSWGPIWDATALWGDSTLWSDTTLWGDTTIWGDTTLWGDTALWGDSTLWSDTVVYGE